MLRVMNCSFAFFLYHPAPLGDGFDKPLQASEAHVRTSWLPAASSEGQDERFPDLFLAFIFTAFGALLQTLLSNLPPEDTRDDEEDHGV